QVVSNLASNAIQAMPAGGTLRIELAIERVEQPRPATIGGRGGGGYVVLSVADAGGRIAPEVVDRIFHPFFTTQESRTGSRPRPGPFTCPRHRDGPRWRDRRRECPRRRHHVHCLPATLRRRCGT